MILHYIRDTSRRWVDDVSLVIRADYDLKFLQIGRIA